MTRYHEDYKIPGRKGLTTCLKLAYKLMETGFIANLITQYLRTCLNDTLLNPPPPPPPPPG